MSIFGRFRKRGLEETVEGKTKKTISKRIDVMSLERDIILALKQVYDPEIPVNIYDLGLIYELRVDEEHNVYIQMTLTAPNCPMADYVVEQVKGGAGQGGGGGCSRGGRRYDRPGVRACVGQEQDVGGGSCGAGSGCRLTCLYFE